LSASIPVARGGRSNRPGPDQRPRIASARGLDCCSPARPGRPAGAMPSSMWNTAAGAVPGSRFTPGWVDTLPSTANRCAGSVEAFLRATTLASGEELFIGDALEDLLEPPTTACAAVGSASARHPPPAAGLRDEQGSARTCWAGRGSVRSACLRETAPTSHAGPYRPPLSSATSGARSRASAPDDWIDKPIDAPSTSPPSIDDVPAHTFSAVSSPQPPSDGDSGRVSGGAVT